MRTSPTSACVEPSLSTIVAVHSPNKSLFASAVKTPPCNSTRDELALPTSVGVGTETNKPPLLASLIKNTENVSPSGSLTPVATVNTGNAPLSSATVNVKSPAVNVGAPPSLSETFTCTAIVCRLPLTSSLSVIITSAVHTSVGGADAIAPPRSTTTCGLASPSYVVSLLKANTARGCTANICAPLALGFSSKTVNVSGSMFVTVAKVNGGKGWP